MFFSTFGTVFIAELGDKTQLLMIAMAAKYKLKSIIAGVISAIVLLNGIAVAVGVTVGKILPVHVVSLIAGIAFMCFAYLSADGNKNGGAEEKEKAGKSGGVFTVFGTFFLAELGDKTQIAALMRAAESGEGLKNAAAVFFGATCALILADFLGLFIGIAVGKALPTSVFSHLSFLLFFSFGTVKILNFFESVTNSKLYGVIFASAVGILFLILSLIKYFRIGGEKNRKLQKNNSKGQQSL